MLASRLLSFIFLITLLLGSSAALAKKNKARSAKRIVVSKPKPKPSPTPLSAEAQACMTAQTCGASFPTPAQACASLSEQKESALAGYTPCFCFYHRRSDENAHDHCSSAKYITLFNSPGYQQCYDALKAYYVAGPWAVCTNSRVRELANDTAFQTCVRCAATQDLGSPATRCTHDETRERLSRSCR